MKALFEYTQYPMDRETSMLFVALAMAGPEQEERAERAATELCAEGNFLPNILTKRLQVMGEILKFEVSHRVQLFLMQLVNSPGDISLYCYALWAIHKRTGNAEVKFDDFVNFFHGFPDASEMSRAWDAQKIKHFKIAGRRGFSDNFVDAFDLYEAEYNGELK